MVHLIPSVKKLNYMEGFLSSKAVSFCDAGWDRRIASVARKLPFDPAGAPLKIFVNGEAGEAYQLDVLQNSITITAEGPAGAFYAIQTLRQLFTQERVPCLHIEDCPDFAYRGFYHDVTRGKIPKVEAIKELIDRMAYYKLNSLQLYVEHTFEFSECKDIIDATGYLTKEELLEIGAYCRENFIDFVPSLSTFGHMYEILQQPCYQHLRALKDYQELPNIWHARMAHHTIDPLHPDSIKLVRCLIDQYSPCFESDWFNICCDETFDLKCCETEQMASSELYVNFAKKIIEHIQSKGKKVMMWADILLVHPEVIDQIPSDVCFLNWFYDEDPEESRFRKFAQMGRKQILCPGTSTWSRLCEDLKVEEQNISRMAEFAHKYGAEGILNTNWGDWGNPCSLDLAMYGLVLGAEKSWSVATQIDQAFYERVNALLYGSNHGIMALKELCNLHEMVKWFKFCDAYFLHRFGENEKYQKTVRFAVSQVQEAYLKFADKYAQQSWDNDAFRQEMLLAAEGLCIIAESHAKLEGEAVKRITDTKNWLSEYRKKWVSKNKESELSKIEEMFLYCDCL